MHTMPTSFLPPVVDHTEFPKDCFLNAHYSPALLERGKGKLNCIAKMQKQKKNRRKESQEGNFKGLN